MYKLIAHRGKHNENDFENTYNSIFNALKSEEYVGVEFDVRVTKDKEFIVFHDAHFNNKLIRNMYYKELPKYVPKVYDILKIKSNKIFLIEIKDIKDNYISFIKLLNKFKEKKIYVMSFNGKVINKLNKQNKNYKLGILNYILNTSTNNKYLDFVCILNSLINDKIIEILKDYEIFSYGLFEKKRYKDIFYIVDN